MAALIEDEIDDVLYFARVADREELTQMLDKLSQKYNCSKADILNASIDPESRNNALHYAAANGHTGTPACPAIFVDGASVSLLLIYSHLRSSCVEHCASQMYEHCKANLWLISDLITWICSTLLDTNRSNPHPKIAEGSIQQQQNSPILLVNAKNDAGNTPLHWAALNGHLAASKALVEAGSDSSIENNAGHDATYEAAQNEKFEVAEWLLSKVESADEGGAEGSNVKEEETEETAGVREEDGTGTSSSEQRKG